jgi:hypothetical protein
VTTSFAPLAGRALDLAVAGDLEVLHSAALVIRRERDERVARSRPV